MSRYLELKQTANNKIYRILRLRDKLSCPICGINRGCNFRNKRKQRTWKVFRSNQHKSNT